MADLPFESGGSEERVWDEYDWERFLQQQDHKTEKYMELLEKYLDDPNRDQIIACEMGWQHLMDENGKDWSADVGHLFNSPNSSSRNGGTPDEETEEDDEETGTLGNEFDDEEDEEDEFDEDDDDEEFEDGEDEEENARNRYDNHPLYQAANALAIHVDSLFAEQDPISQHPAVVRLTTNSTLTNVKLAAALSDDDSDEPGMTIAYLKRALKAITNALDAVVQCRNEQIFDHEGAADLRTRVFQVRDGIVSLMGDYRSEWRRRYGDEEGNK